MSGRKRIPRTRLAKRGAALAKGGEAELYVPMNDADRNGIGMSPGHVQISETP